jgi:hypothetical protein
MILLLAEKPTLGILIGIKYRDKFKTMNLIIALDGNNISLAIKEGEKTVDELSWVGEHSLSEQLLPKIDELLLKNGLNRKAVDKVLISVSSTSGVTSSRIVQTVAEAWNAGLSK